MTILIIQISFCDWGLPKKKKAHLLRKLTPFLWWTWRFEKVEGKILVGDFHLGRNSRKGYASDKGFIFLIRTQDFATTNSIWFNSLSRLHLISLWFSSWIITRSIKDCIILPSISTDWVLAKETVEKFHIWLLHKLWKVMS